MTRNPTIETSPANLGYEQKLWLAAGSVSDRCRNDDGVRWQFGVPPKGNVNFVWMQHCIRHRALSRPGTFGGLAGFVLSNSSMSSDQSDKGENRWFISKNKNDGKPRNHCEQTLFIDAHKIEHSCRDLTYLGIERIYAVIQARLRKNGGAKCEYSSCRDIHLKAA